MIDPLARVIGSFPKQFWQSLQEQTDTAFAEALHLAKKYIDEPEQPNMLGQLRHARCEVGFRNAAQSAGFPPSAPHTERMGSRYSIVKNNGVYLLRANVQAHCGTPRPTRFRREWASLNKWLDPLQLSFLKNAEPLPDDKLCGLIVVTAYRDKRLDQSSPAFLGLGIPNQNLSSWYMLKSINALLAQYHDIETRKHTPNEIPVTIKDRAMPRIKKSLNRSPEAEE
ncbi:MAG: hypothetical protein IPL99_15615 [Candidatus Competibacteraceae bacterium]|nr:hypothetical protein [Candidatus Competibacteraceae bacterium]